MKSFLLIFTPIFVGLMAHTGLRIYGYTHNYSERRSPILAEVENHIYSPTLSIENYQENLKSIKEACKEECLLSLDTYLTKDNQLVLLSDTKNQYQHLKSKDIKSFEEIETLTKNNVLTLEKFLTDFPQAKGVIHFEANTPGIVKALTPVFSKNKRHKSFVLCSRYGNIVRTIRDSKQHWKTCASQDEETKAHILSSIFLESIAGFPTEYFFFTDIDLSRYSLRLFDEVKRRTYFSIIPFELKNKVPARAYLHSNLSSYLQHK